MRKLTKILSITSIALSAATLLLFIASLTFLWNPMCLLISAPQQAAAAGPIAPIGNIISLVGSFLVALMVFARPTSERTISVELISIVLLSLILPILSKYLSTAQLSSIGRSILSYEQRTTYSVTITICNYVCSFTNFSSVLCFVVCGISIAEKVHARKPN